jgi:arabinofuranosyltransferase
MDPTPTSPLPGAAASGRPLVLRALLRLIHAPAPARFWTAAGVALCAASALALALYARGFLPFIADDALISLRYSERLLQGDGLTWTDGERVEGYSNLLWVLGVAATAWLGGGDVIAAARVLGLTGMVATVGAVAFAYRARRARELAAPLAGALTIALAGPIAVWAVGGLEQALVAPLLAWALALSLPLVEVPSPSFKRVLAAGLPLALLCITRPDGALFAVASGAALLLGRVGRGLNRASLRLVLTLAALPIAFTAAQLAFRLAYYGEWVPNTAHVKANFTVVRLREGLGYLLTGARGLPALTLALLAGLGLLATRARRRALVVLLPMVAWSAYVASVGGDIFPAYRHLVPVLVLAAFVLAEAAAWLANRPPLVAAAAFVLVLAVPALASVQRTDPEIHRARTERWEWDGKAVGELLARAFGHRHPLLAADPAGCLPFFSKLPSLDMLGLNDRFLATHPPPGFGRGPLGHELGNGAYVLSRRPDLVSFCTPPGSERPCFRSGHEMVASETFGRDYQLVRLETPAPRVLRAPVWVRREGRVGIVRAEGEIRLPGFLLADNRETLARLGASGALEAVVSDVQPARLLGLTVPPGRWQVSARADGTTLVRVRQQEAPGPPEEALDAVTIDLEGAAALDIEVAAPPGQERRLIEVVLKRAALQGTR